MAPTSPPGSCDFTVGWICALLIEYIAALEVLDETYEDNTGVLQAQGDYNVYTQGRIGNHHVVVVCLPAESYGLVSASGVVTSMRSSFPSIRFALMVGIAGGSPRSGEDVRLGDVVIGTQVIPYLFGKQTPTGHEYTGHVPRPPEILLCRVNPLKHRTMTQLSIEQLVDDKIARMSSQMKHRFQRPAQTSDRLYSSEYLHNEACDCIGSTSRLSGRIVAREARVQGSRVVVHSGRIASGDQVIKDARIRDSYSNQLKTLCFDMESAALTNIGALGIRGICDYADSHKNDQWHGYAAIAAAVCAVEFLKSVPVTDVHQSRFNMTEEEVRRFVAASIEEVKGAVNGTPTLANQVAISKVNNTLEGVEQRLMLLDRLEKSVMTNKGQTDLTAINLRNLEDSHNQLQAALNDLAETVLHQRDKTSNPETKQTWNNLHISITDKSERFRRGAAFMGDALGITAGVLNDVGEHTGNKDFSLATKMTEHAGFFMHRLGKRGEKDKAGSGEQVRPSKPDQPTKSSSTIAMPSLRPRWHKNAFSNGRSHITTAMDKLIPHRNSTKNQGDQSNGTSGNCDLLIDLEESPTPEYLTPTAALADRRDESMTPSPASSGIFSINTDADGSSWNGSHRTSKSPPLRPQKPKRLQSGANMADGVSHSPQVQQASAALGGNQTSRPAVSPGSNQFVLRQARMFDKSGSFIQMNRPIDNTNCPD